MFLFETNFTWIDEVRRTNLESNAINKSQY